MHCYGLHNHSRNGIYYQVVFHFDALFYAVSGGGLPAILLADPDNTRKKRNSITY